MSLVTFAFDKFRRDASRSSVLTERRHPIVGNNNWHLPAASTGVQCRGIGVGISSRQAFRLADSQRRTRAALAIGPRLLECIRDKRALQTIGIVILLAASILTRSLSLVFLDLNRSASIGDARRRTSRDLDGLDRTRTTSRLTESVQRFLPLNVNN